MKAIMEKQYNSKTQLLNNRLPELKHNKYFLIKQNLPRVFDLLYSRVLHKKATELLGHFRAEFAPRREEMI